MKSAVDRLLDLKCANETEFLSLVVEAVRLLVSKAARPGVLGIIGHKVEKRCRADLSAYFRALGKDIKALKLEALVESGNTVEVVRHSVEMRMDRIVRNHRSLLLQALALNIQDAYLTGWKFDPFAGADTIAPRQRKKNGIQEADSWPDLGNQFANMPPAVLFADQVGPSGEAAAQYAATQAAQLVVAIDTVTKDKIADAIAQGITDQLSVPATARLIKSIVGGMSTDRAQMIASTEMNRSFSQASLDKMFALEIEYKQVILADDACDACQENADADPIPVGEAYPSGDLTTPFHPNCRCAVTGSRSPEDLE